MKQIYEEPKITIKEFQKYKIVTLASGDPILDAEQFPEISETGTTEGGN